MRIKSFFSESVEAALFLAQAELGPDALLLKHRESPPEAQHLGRYEVVFALESEPEPAPRPDATPAPVSPAAAARAVELAPSELSQLVHEIAEMRNQLAQIRETQRAEMVPRAAPLPPMAGDAIATLLEAGIEPWLAEDIVRTMPAFQAGPAAASRVMTLEPGAPRASKTVASVGEDALLQQLAAEMGHRFRVDATLGVGSEGRRIVALVGPPGAGKTSTLVKLAVQFGLNARKPALLISMDTHRIGAAQQLCTYADLLGVACLVLETGRALEQALEEHRGKGLILIDTPGYGAADFGDAAELAGVLAAHPEVNTHLVLPASMRAADMSQAVERYEIFHPDQLLFTKLDETGALGSLVSESVHSGKPISFLSKGQAIPEDLEPATKDRIIELVLRRSAVEARSAA